MARKRYHRRRGITLRKKQKGGNFLQFLGPLGQILGSQLGMGINKRKQKKGGFFATVVDRIIRKDQREKKKRRKQKGLGLAYGLDELFG